MSPEPAPDGWPVVGPPSRLLSWIFAAATTLQVACAVLGVVVEPFPTPSPVWRLLLAVGGLGLVLGGTAWGWAMVVRGTPLRVVRSGARSPARTWAERRRVRRTLLDGGELGDGDELWVANQLAGAAPLRLVLAVLASVAGSNLLSLATLESSTWPYMAALDAVVVACLLPPAGILLWVRRMRRPAEAVGAVPIRAGAQPAEPA